MFKNQKVLVTGGAGMIGRITKGQKIGRIPFLTYCLFFGKRK